MVQIDTVEVDCEIGSSEGETVLNEDEVRRKEKLYKSFPAY